MKRKGLVPVMILLFTTSFAGASEQSSPGEMNKAGGESIPPILTVSSLTKEDSIEQLFSTTTKSKDG